MWSKDIHSKYVQASKVKTAVSTLTWSSIAKLHNVTVTPYHMSNTENKQGSDIAQVSHYPTYFPQPNL